MFARITAAVTVVLALSAPAWAADRENLQVARDVSKQVLTYSQFSIFDAVNMQINDGTVMLTGKVTMPYKRTDIEKRIAKLAAVTSIDNQIEVLPVSQFDNQLRFQIARAIYSNHNFRPFASMVNPPIHIIVKNGNVTLEGVVLNKSDATRAFIAANGVGSILGEEQSPD